MLNMKSLLQNKKLMVVLGVVVLVIMIGVGVVALFNKGFDGADKKGSDTDTKVEFNENEDETQDNVKGNNSDADKTDNKPSVEVIEDSNKITEDYVDVSGSWDDSMGDDYQENADEPEEDEDILEDEIIWGDVY